MAESIVKNKSFEFALIVIKLYSFLMENKEFIISKQLLRSGTSIGANINEALAGESKADFLHKMSIANKEARETLYWLELLKQSQIVSSDYKKHIDNCNEIVKILTNIVRTTKNNLIQLKTQHSKFKTN